MARARTLLEWCHALAFPGAECHRCEGSGRRETPERPCLHVCTFSTSTGGAMFGLHFLDLSVIWLFVLLWLLPAMLVYRDAGRRPVAGRMLGRRCAAFGLPGALLYFGLLHIHHRLQAQKEQRRRQLE